MDFVEIGSQKKHNALWEIQIEENLIKSTKTLIILLYFSYSRNL